MKELSGGMGQSRMQNAVSLHGTRAWQEQSKIGATASCLGRCISGALVVLSCEARDQEFSGRRKAEEPQQEYPKSNCTHAGRCLTGSTAHDARKGTHTAFVPQQVTRTRRRCSAKRTSLLAPVILLLEGALMLLPLCFVALQIALVRVLHLPQGSPIVIVGARLKHSCHRKQPRVT